MGRRTRGQEVGLSPRVLYHLLVGVIVLLRPSQGLCAREGDATPANLIVPPIWFLRPEVMLIGAEMSIRRRSKRSATSNVANNPATEAQNVDAPLPF